MAKVKNKEYSSESIRYTLGLWLLQSAETGNFDSFDRVSSDIGKVSGNYKFIDWFAGMNENALSPICCLH